MGAAPFTFRELRSTPGCRSGKSWLLFVACFAPNNGVPLADLRCPPLSRGYFAVILSPLIRIVEMSSLYSLSLKLLYPSSLWLVRLFSGIAGLSAGPVSCFL
jgi:hypothetical protein